MYVRDLVESRGKSKIVFRSEAEGVRAGLMILDSQSVWEKGGMCAWMEGIIGAGIAEL